MDKIAIYGFGRIGRSLLRVALRSNLFVPAVVADVRDSAILAALFEVDTNYGRWPERVLAEEQAIMVGERRISYHNATKELPDWAALGVGLVIDCSGRATVRAGAHAHLDRGARRVLVSAPSKTIEDCDAVLLPGINLEQFDPEKHFIVSMASCTSNALAPVVKVLMDHFGIKSGFFTTVHSYTNSQSLTDQPMKDRRDSWAAAENIIPSSSGAAKALKYIWPNLDVTGKAYRVPTRTGSIVELNAVLNTPTKVEELRELFQRAAAEPPLAGIMAVLEEEWSAARIVGDSHSSIIDLPLLQVLGENFVSIAAWYDNELGYSQRLAETAVTLNS